MTIIGQEAFYGCSSLTSIIIPEAVTTIGDSAFSGCSDSFTICGKSGSYAETYAKKNQIPFKQLYTVTFDANSGTNLSVSKKKIEKDKAIGTLPTVEKEGYTFKGWYTDAAGGTKVTEGTVIKKDTTFYAQWEKVIVSIEKATVTLSKTSYTYDGTAKTPSVKVKLGSKTLVKDRDYTVKYDNNKAVGTARVTITGNRKGGYTGTVSKNFKISAASLKKAKVTLSTTSYTYNGNEKRPSVTVKLGSKTLKKNTDYTVSYKNNKNIGTATVTIKGKGSYTGTVSETFSIKVKKGTTFTSGTNKYKVTGTSTVAFSEIASNKTTKVTIPKTVTYGGKTFNITSIAGSALKGKTKVTQVTIGENVKTISTLAFYGCKNVKTITIKSTKLNTVGTKAFKGIYSKATIKVPKSKLTSYKKLLKDKGQGSKVKIVK